MKAALSPAFADLRGKAGNVVVTRSRSGLVVHPKIIPPDPRTQAQQKMRADMAKAGTAYKNLTPEQCEAWQTYAQTLTKTNPISGQTYAPTAINVFTGLAIKLLQLDPNAPIPLTPPQQTFRGDDLQITLDANTPGHLTLTANHPNTPGTVTEILLQKLPSRNRKPHPRAYRHETFTNFQTPTTLTLQKGFYALAYKYTNQATGQSTTLNPMPKLEVQ